MQQANDSTSAVVAEAKSNFERFSGRLLHLLSFVPDDKLTWAPSPTAKSALRVVAHCALTIRFCADVMTDDMPESLPSLEEFFQNLNDAEMKFTTRESAVALVKAATSELCTAMDTMNAENIDSPAKSPFGTLPKRFWMYQGREQLAGHAGQLEYLQTIWGDLDNHYG